MILNASGGVATVLIVGLCLRGHFLDTFIQAIHLGSMPGCWVRGAGHLVEGPMSGSKASYNPKGPST